MTDLEKQTASSPAPRKSTAPWIAGALSLGIAAGLSVGWWGHELQTTQAKKEADAAVQGEGDRAAGPCKTWADAICGRMGKAAYECKVAQGASALLSGSACAQAEEGVLAKIDTLEAKRAPCTQLSSKLCGDLGEDGKGCELIVAKEPGIAPQDCQDMMGRYEQTLAQIMSRQTKGTLPDIVR
jgi:hypothetical protein